MQTLRIHEHFECLTGCENISNLLSWSYVPDQTTHITDITNCSQLAIAMLYIKSDESVEK